VSHRILCLSLYLSLFLPLGSLSLSLSPSLSSSEPNFAGPFCIRTTVCGALPTTNWHQSKRDAHWPNLLLLSRSLASLWLTRFPLLSASRAAILLLWLPLGGGWNFCVSLELWPAHAHGKGNSRKAAALRGQRTTAIGGGSSGGITRNKR